MKYLLAILISFAVINPVLAAKTVKGSVPVVQPLQPPPAGVSPAFNRSVQYQDPNFVPINGRQNPQNNQPGQTSVPTRTSSVAMQKGGYYIWWLIVLLIVFVLGFWIYKRSKSE
jgi:hypothetical protein